MKDYTMIRAVSSGGINGNEIPNIENYRALGAAVIQLAAADYVSYYRAGNDEYKRIERFFRSDLFKVYSDLDPEYLISGLRRIKKRR